MFKNLIPWRKKSEAHPTRGELAGPMDQQIAKLQDQFQSMYDRFWTGDLMVGDELERWHMGWGCDVKDSDNEIVIRADAPGFEPDEIDIRMSGNQLILEAEHREEKKGNGNGYRYDKFHRSMTMPRGIKPDDITAEYKNGVLEVHCPKGPETHAKRIAVKAK